MVLVSRSVDPGDQLFLSNCSWVWIGVDWCRWGGWCMLIGRTCRTVDQPDGLDWCRIGVGCGWWMVGVDRSVPVLIRSRSLIRSVIQIVQILSRCVLDWCRIGVIVLDVDWIQVSMDWCGLVWNPDVVWMCRSVDQWSRSVDPVVFCDNGLIGSWMWMSGLMDQPGGPRIGVIVDPDPVDPVGVSVVSISGVDQPDDQTGYPAVP